MIDAISLLTAATLLGVMTFFSFGFAPVIFAQLPMEKVRPLLRGTFPYYNLAVIICAGVATALALQVDPLAACLPFTAFASTIYARQILMGQINAATDRVDTGAFKRLHGASVVIQLIQIGLAAWAVVRLG